MLLCFVAPFQPKLLLLLFANRRGQKKFSKKQDFDFVHVCWQKAVKAVP